MLFCFFVSYDPVWDRVCGAYPRKTQKSPAECVASYALIPGTAITRATPLTSLGCMNGLVPCLYFFLKKRFPVSISTGRFQDDTSDDESAFILNYKFRMTIALSFAMNFQIHLHIFVMTNSTKQDQYCIYFVAIYLY